MTLSLDLPTPVPTLQAIVLSNVHAIVGEWIPFGANQIVALNERLGALDRCQGGLFSSLIDKYPTELNFESDPGLTEVSGTRVVVGVRLTGLRGGREGRVALAWRERVTALGFSIWRRRWRSRRLRGPGRLRTALDLTWRE